MSIVLQTRISAERGCVGVGRIRPSRIMTKPQAAYACDAERPGSRDPRKPVLDHFDAMRSGRKRAGRPELTSRRHALTGQLALTITCICGGIDAAEELPPFCHFDIPELRLPSNYFPYHCRMPVQIEDSMRRSCRSARCCYAT